MRFAQRMNTRRRSAGQGKGINRTKTRVFLLTENTNVQEPLLAFFWQGSQAKRGPRSRRPKNNGKVLPCIISSLFHSFSYMQQQLINVFPAKQALMTSLLCCLTRLHLMAYIRFTSSFIPLTLLPVHLLPEPLVGVKPALASAF